MSWKRNQYDKNRNRKEKSRTDATRGVRTFISDEFVGDEFTYGKHILRSGRDHVEPVFEGEYENVDSNGINKG